jgi:UDP-2,3-diacylglucosamine hydrolase
MSHSFELQVGAYIISDAHYSHLREELLSFFKEIESRKLLPTQLILMGDIFDALFGSVKYTYEKNSEIMQVLESISNQIEVIFLEGNHDFNLKKTFSNIKVFPLQKQPVLCAFQGKKIALAHGDFDAPFGYQLYTSIIRNPIVLTILNFIDRKIGDAIIQKIDGYLSKKDDCKEFRGFEKYISGRELQKYECDYFIEGHYHQNKRYNFHTYIYINLAAFACNQRYFIVKSLEDKELFIEENSHKEM